MWPEGCGRSQWAGGGAYELGDGEEPAGCSTAQTTVAGQMGGPGLCYTGDPNTHTFAGQQMPSPGFPFPGARCVQARVPGGCGRLSLARRPGGRLAEPQTMVPAEQGKSGG